MEGSKLPWRKGRSALLCGVAVTAIETNGGGVHAATGDGTVTARFLVAADGHYSFVRRCLRQAAPPELGTCTRPGSFGRRLAAGGSFVATASTTGRKPCPKRSEPCPIQ